MDETKRILGNQIEELKKLHKNPRPEVRTDFHKIKAEMLESFRAMQKENSVILSELTEMKELVKKIFQLVVQISYKVNLTFGNLIFTFILRMALRQLMLHLKPLSLRHPLRTFSILPLSFRRQPTSTLKPREFGNISRF